MQPASKWVQGRQHIGSAPACRLSVRAQALTTGPGGKKVNKVVLAYSGGLDTSVILKWLQETYDCEVVTFTADLGQVCKRWCMQLHCTATVHSPAFPIYACSFQLAPAGQDAQVLLVCRPHLLRRRSSCDKSVAKLALECITTSNLKLCNIGRGAWTCTGKGTGSRCKADFRG